MKPDKRTSLTTTFRLPFTAQAELEAIRLQRAADSGQRPSTRALILEAVLAFIATQPRSRKVSRGVKGGAP